MIFHSLYILFCLPVDHESGNLAMTVPSVHGDFLRHAVLDTVIPHNPNVDIEAALTAALEGGAADLDAVLAAIPQRSLLFFGMFCFSSIVRSASFY